MKKLLIAGAIGLGLCIAAWAQALAPLNLTGSEVWVVSLGSVGGSGVYVPINQVRNTTGYGTVATGGTVTSTPTNQTSNLIAIGAITVWNVTLPNPAFDGMDFSVVNGTGSAFTTNVTVTAATTPQNQTLNNAFSSQTLGANGGSAEFQYVFATSTWYRIR